MNENNLRLYNNVKHIQFIKDEPKYETVVINDDSAFFYHKSKFPVACNTIVEEKHSQKPKDR